MSVQEAQSNGYISKCYDLAYCKLMPMRQFTGEVNQEAEGRYGNQCFQEHFPFKAPSLCPDN